MSVTRKLSKLRKSLPSEYLILTLIVALGIALRLYHLQFYLDDGGVDSMWYTNAGFIYSNGDLLTSSATVKGPLLTLLLGLSIRIFGPTYLVTKYVSLIAGSLLPIVVFFLGSELFGKKVGLLSALIISITPLLIFYHGLVYREPLYSFAWTSCMYFALRGFKGSTIYSIIGGIFFALSSATIELGIFTGIGLILYFSFQKLLRNNKTRKFEYKNLDVFFFSALLTITPFLVKDYLTYRDPFLQWQSLDFLAEFVPISPSVIMWAYVGLMALSIPYALIFKLYRFDIRYRRRFSGFASPRNHSKRIKVYLYAIIVILAMLVVFYEVLKGPGPAAKAGLGVIKLFEVLAFPESMGFLLIFSLLTLIYVAKSSSDVVLILSAFLFSAAGLAWGITSHYGYWLDLSFGEILSFLPNTPLDNAFRYVSSYVPLLTIFASYGIFLLAERSVRKIVGGSKKKARRTRMLETAVVLILTLIFVFQFIYANGLVIEKAQRNSHALEKEYGWAVEWLSTKGSPIVYSFNSMFKEEYGQNKVVLLNDESLLEIGRRATFEKIEFIVSDIFGAYSEAQQALLFGGFYEDPSRVGLDRFQLVKSYTGWPRVQIFKISIVEPNQTALIVQHEDWGQEWVPILSESYLVDVVTDEDDLTSHFSWDYKIIVLTDIKRPLTNDELNILQQKVASGAILIVNGLSPAYMNLINNGYWIGAKNFVEAPADAKWEIRFTENALSVSSEIDLNKSYALYSTSMWSSPTGLNGIEEGVAVHAARVEDGAAAIFAKPYVDGVVIFSGVRPSYATAAAHYGIYVDFVESLIEKAIDKTLFP